MRMINLVLFSVLCSVLILLLQFGFIFILLGLMPSIVAYYIDNEPRKTSFKIVFAGNLSAALPTITPMLKAAINFRSFDVVSAFRDPSVWLFIYMGAAAGWCLIFISRQLARIITAMRYEMRIAALQKEQSALLQEWGNEIMPANELKKAESLLEE